MQRYRWDRIDEELVADPNGECVPADVAQRLYDALAEMVESYGDVSFLNVEEREADPSVIEARAALAAADEEGEG